MTRSLPHRYGAIDGLGEFRQAELLVSGASCIRVILYDDGAFG